MPAAVVLAAGEGRRMGGAKAHVLWHGRSLGAWAVGLARWCDARPTVFVWGAAPPPPDLPRDDAVVCVQNPNGSEGPVSSLRAGLEAVPPGRPVLVLTVDRPHVAPSTAAALLAALGDAPLAAVQPVHRGRHGHPVLLSAGAADRLRGRRVPSLRAFLRGPEMAPHRRFVEVDDPAVVDNVDTPEDLARLQGIPPPYPAGA